MADRKQVFLVEWPNGSQTIAFGENLYDIYSSLDEYGDPAGAVLTPLEGSGCVDSRQGFNEDLIESMKEAACSYRLAYNPAEPLPQDKVSLKRVKKSQVVYSSREGTEWTDDFSRESIAKLAGEILRGRQM